MLLKLSIISCVILIISQSPVNAIKCNANNYTLTKGVGWYKFHTRAKNWYEASKICEGEGAHLAIIDSEQEKIAIIDMIVKERFNIVDVSRKDLAWLGGYKAIGEKKSEWVTVLGKSLTSTGYENWAKGCYGYPAEPNNYDGDENCLSVFLNCDQGLNDHSCDRALSFVCEKSDTCESNWFLTLLSH